MTIREEALEVLYKVTAEIFTTDRAKLSPSTDFATDLGAKSVSIVQISAALENAFDVEVPYMELSRRKTIGDAADLIAKLFGE